MIVSSSCPWGCGRVSAIVPMPLVWLTWQAGKNVVGENEMLRLKTHVSRALKGKKIGSLSPSNCLLCLLSQWLFVTVRKWAWIVAFESKLAEWIRLLVSLLWSQFVSVVTATPHNRNTKHLCLLKSLLVNRLIPPTQLKGSSINFTHLSEFTDLMKYSCICRGKQKCIKPFLAPEKLHVIW